MAFAGLAWPTSLWRVRTGGRALLARSRLRQGQKVLALSLGQIQQS